MGERYPCGCEVRQYRQGTPAGDSEWSSDEKLFRCARHQKQFDKEFAWDSSRGKWVNNDKAYKLKQARILLRHLENQHKDSEKNFIRVAKEVKKQQILVDELRGE